MRRHQPGRITGQSTDPGHRAVVAQPRALRRYHVTAPREGPLHVHGPARPPVTIHVIHTVPTHFSRPFGSGTRGVTTAKPWRLPGRDAGSAVQLLHRRRQQVVHGQ